MIRNKRYSELIQLPTFEERFEYCKCPGVVGAETFGVKRWLNQVFYKSELWRNVIRPYVVARDFGYDLGVTGCSISGLVIVHHIIPITEDDIRNQTDILTDYDNLICVSDTTHKAIHYGTIERTSKYTIGERTPGDTKLW